MGLEAQNRLSRCCSGRPSNTPYPVDGSWRVLFRCWWSAPTCPGRSVKIRIDFCCVHEHRRWPSVWCVHEQRPTGEIRFPDRPTERPGYAQIARARPTTAQKERGPYGARVARYLGPNTPAALRTGTKHDDIWCIKMILATVLGTTPLPCRRKRFLFVQAKTKRKHRRHRGGIQTSDLHCKLHS